MRQRRTPKAGLLMVVAVLVVSVAAAHGAGWNEAAAARHRAVHGAASPTAHATALQGLATLAPSVAALRASRTTADAVDARLVASPLLRDGIAAPSLSRRVGYAQPAWFVPGSDGRSVCILTTRSVSCPPIAEVEQQGLAPSAFWSPRGPVRIAGIAADEVRDVDVTMTEGSLRRVPITNNLLDFTSGAAPREVQWDGPDGPHRFVLPDLARR